MDSFCLCFQFLRIFVLSFLSLFPCWYPIDLGIITLSIIQLINNNMERWWTQDGSLQNTVLVPLVTPLHVVQPILYLESYLQLYLLLMVLNLCLNLLVSFCGCTTWTPV